MARALILEGGAKRGIYTAGVLDVFLEHGIKFDAVFGVSAGAIHGCSYVAKQHGRSIRYNRKYGNDPRFMSLQNWLKTGNVVDTEFCYHELPDTLDPFDHQTFENANCRFFVVCSNLLSGQAEYIHCPELRTKIDLLRASASLPFFSQIVEFGGQKYLDGGICDSIPLQAAQDMGYNDNVVVLTRPLGYRKPYSALSAFIAKLVYRNYPKFAAAIASRAKMYNAELDYVASQEASGKITVLRPSKFINIHKMEKDPAVVEAMYQLGRADAENSSLVAGICR